MGRHREGYELIFAQGCEDLDRFFRDKFGDYDMNNSGTIDTYKEMKQLTLNLISTLDVDGKHMSHLSGANGKERRLELMREFEGKYLIERPLTFEEYIVWFMVEVLDKYYVFHAGIEEDSSSSSEEDEDKRFAHVDVQSLYKWRATSHQCQLYLTLQSNVAHVALGAGWEQQHPDSVEEGSAVQVSSDNPNVAMVIPAHTGLHYAEPEPPPEFVPRVDQEIPDHARKKDGHCCDHTIDQIRQDCAIT